MDYRSKEAVEWRKLYSTTEWKRLRKAQLEADNYGCVFCRARYVTKLAKVVDHIRAHKGDPVLFHDPTNLQSLCKPCHDSHKRSVEQHGYHGMVGDDGWPLDPAHPANRKPKAK